MIVEAIRCSSDIYEQASAVADCLMPPTDGWSAPSRRVTVIVAAEGWSVSPSRRVLEAAQIRNEHRKVQSLYENK